MSALRAAYCAEAAAEWENLLEMASRPGRRVSLAVVRRLGVAAGIDTASIALVAVAVGATPDAAVPQPSARVLSAAELSARARSYDRKALDAEDAGRPLDADRYRRRALLARRASVLASAAAIGARS